MSLVDHARRELELLGLFDEDSDYEGMVGEAVLELVEVFSKQGHSGFSAGYVLGIFDVVARYEALSPLTDHPDEWNLIAREYTAASNDLWQNNRDSRMFSDDGGKTYYNVDDPERTLTESKKS